MRPVPQAALSIAQQFEGFRPKRYLDTGGRPTIGYGHLLAGPSDPLWNATLSDESGQELLAQDMVNRAALPLETVLGSRLSSLTDNQYAALLDFTFNEGAGRFKGSTICHMIVTGAAASAIAPQFGRWVYGVVNGQEVVLQDLVRRRAAETALWNS